MGEPCEARPLLGLDVGSVRIGVAWCGTDGLLAVPLCTVAADPAGGTDLSQVLALVEEHGVSELVVGLPLSLSGAEGVAAQTVREWAGRLLLRAPGLTVRLVDERLTTVHAHRQMGAAGRREKARRELVDQAAAVAILETFLQARRQGRPLPGTVLRGQPPAARRPRARQKERNA